MRLHFLKLCLALIIVFFFKTILKVLKDVLKELNWFVKSYFFVEITLFRDYYSAFHYFRVFLLFSKFAFMDLASLGQVFFIWMLCFITFGNRVIFKSKVCNVLSNLMGV
jgi:hypothetical protein